MAKIKFSALVSEMSGKLNGSVVVRGKSGAFIRNRVIPINANTASQNAVRQNFAIISKAWSNLTETQRATWNAGVENWKYSNLFADIKKLSGKALFQKLNSNLVLNGFALINNCPEKSEFTAIKIVEAVILNDFTNTIEIGTIDESNFPASNNAYILKLSNIGNSGTYKFQNLTKIAIIPNVEDVATVAFNTDQVIAGLEAKGGVIAGKVYGIEIFALNITTGETTPSLNTRIVIGEA